MEKRMSIQAVNAGLIRKLQEKIMTTRLSIDTFENDGNDLACGSCGRIINRDEEVNIIESSIGLRLMCEHCMNYVQRMLDQVFIVADQFIRDQKKKQVYGGK